MTWIGCLRPFIPIRAGPMLGQIHGQQNASRSAEKMLGNSSAKSFQNLTITTFHPREFVTENDTVVVIGFESGIVTATGHPFRNECVQKYVVQEDLITEMEEYNI